MTSDEIRADFLRFFEGKGHRIIPSSSLIPQGDPTLLLTTAGMVQFKPYFLGIETPLSPRLASCQKCFRTTDVESVGDATHLTFFEMLGNFSIGDYFKKEAIGWAWEFVTAHLKLPVDRLWITIFLDDDEAFRYWRDIGVREGRIIRLGEDTNFWGPAGDSGPCGPCSEIHYDLGERVKCEKDACLPGCDCGRYSEIWNLVFTQYNQDKSGKRTLLPKPNIDTGMGLERLSAIMQGKTSVYETDIFTPLLQRVAKLSGKKYGSDPKADLAMRVVAEHSRGIAFLIGDGVLPANEGRGYVLRRLLRRTVLFGRRLGLDKPFLTQIAETTIKQMGQVYPELEQRRDTILKITGLEEARFSETLSTGLELLSGIMDAADKKKHEISGLEAFKLYDTYGFPVEITEEIARERKFTVDMPGFKVEMAKQRERARAVLRCAKCGTRLKDSDKKCPKCGSTEKARGPLHFDITIVDRIIINDTLSVSVSKATIFTGYTTLKQEAVIMGILVNNSPVNEAVEGQEAGIILDTTSFYGEMGGQVGDTGEIRSQGGRFPVTDTARIQAGIIVHKGTVTAGVLSVGDSVEAEVDEERRRDIARNHTATHLLQMALRQVIGEHVQQRGSLVGPDRFSFDFSYLSGLTTEEMQQVQRLVNEKIRQDLPVYGEEMPYKQAIKEGVIALFDEKYGDVVRVLRVGKPPVSAELCGGTHAGTTGEIGFLYILGEHSIGSGLRRIEAVTGRGAERFIGRRLSSLTDMASRLATEVENISDKVDSLITERDQEHKRVQALESELAKIEAESLLNRTEIINGVKVLAAKVSSCSPDVLREMSDLLRDRLGSSIIVLGTIFEDKPAFIAAVTPDLVAKGFDAGRIIREVAKVAGGGGGGKPTLAQAGGKDKSKLDEALHIVAKLITF